MADSMSFFEAVTMSNKCMSYRDFFEQLLGKEKWSTRVSEYKEKLTDLKIHNECKSYIETIIPIAKDMSDNYDDPSQLIAIAVQLDLDNHAT